jgi:hypothetical protein
MDHQLPALLSRGNAMANAKIIAEVYDKTQRFAVKQAFVWSLRNLWIMYACMSGVGILVSVFIAEKALSKEYQEIKAGLGNT